ncbi:hypothetical protein TVAG_113550 [Trichomonas vaginalis G3]|uniref:Uncharacterized protein n=1 Tax=Trichomonas vaginalis (strain ATCC PRA-98 / G3) TaxID=412133 RepID=A2DNK8_TRIV3|nr:hypothetical protein TVAG_113550 [Trichomonas vaginalis G3]|eukprot:XP_001578997.1 hypothetical protein [Trichomonas vaginalis G3]
MTSFSAEEQPKWNECLSYTIKQLMEENPDIAIRDARNQALENFRKNNYPLSKSVADKSKRIKHSKKEQAAAVEKMSPEMAAFIKKTKEDLKKEFPYSSDKDLTEQAKHKYILHIGSQ